MRKLGLRDAGDMKCSGVLGLFNLGSPVPQDHDQT